MRSYRTSSPSNIEEHALLERFLDALWMEQGLSDHTLSAYRADLSGTILFLHKYGRSLADARREDLLSYLSQRVKAGARPRTTARLLSSLRRFYQYMVREGRLEVDPSAQIDAPKLGRHFPHCTTDDRRSVGPWRRVA